MVHPSHRLSIKCIIYTVIPVTPRVDSQFVFVNRCSGVLGSVSCSIWYWSIPPKCLSWIMQPNTYVWIEMLCSFQFQVRNLNWISTEQYLLKLSHVGRLWSVSEIGSTGQTHLVGYNQISGTRYVRHTRGYLITCPIRVFGRDLMHGNPLSYNVLTLWTCEMQKEGAI